MERRQLKSPDDLANLRTKEADGSSIFTLFSALINLLALILLCLCSVSAAQAVTVSSAKTGVTVRLDEKTGHYEVAARLPGWTFAGYLGSAAHSVRSFSGKDRIGVYQEIAFNWQNGQHPLRGFIRLYQNSPLLLFRYTYLKPASPPSVAFPSFTSIPAHLYHFSYKNLPFAPPQFKLGQYGTPWLLFDAHADAMVISPASHFIIAAMHGNGDHLIASGLNDQLPSVPADFS